MHLHRPIALAIALATVGFAAPAALAKGGDPGTTTSRCARVTVTNTGQTVRHPDQMPDIKYNLENCGTEAVNVTVTMAEAPGFLSVLCPAPMAAPVTVSLAVKAKVSLSAAAYRGPCGYSGPRSSTVVWSSNAWQGHNVAVTPIDASTGLALGAGPWFSWQDTTNPGV